LANFSFRAIKTILEVAKKTSFEQNFKRDMKEDAKVNLPFHSTTSKWSRFAAKKVLTGYQADNDEEKNLRLNCFLSPILPRSNK